MNAKPQDIGITILVNPDLVFPKPDQPRRYFSQESLKGLAKSLKLNGQEQPVKVKVLGSTQGGVTTYQLIDGERRWRACSMSGRDLWAVVCSVRSDAEHFRSSAVSNLGSEQLYPLEIANSLARIQRDYPAMTQAELSEIFCKSHGWAGQYLALLRLAPGVQKLLSPEIPKDERLPFFVATSLVPFSHEEQIKIAAKIQKHKWKTTRALQEIRMQGRKLGIEVDGKKKSTRNPREDYRLLLSFLRKVKADADIVLQIKSARFDEMFSTRAPAERLAVLRSLQDCFESMGLIQTMIKHSTRPGNIAALKLA